MTGYADSVSSHGLNDLKATGCALSLFSEVSWLAALQPVQPRAGISTKRSRGVLDSFTVALVVHRVLVSISMSP